MTKVYTKYGPATTKLMRASGDVIVTFDAVTDMGRGCKPNKQWTLSPAEVEAITVEDPSIKAAREAAVREVAEVEANEKLAATACKVTLRPVNAAGFVIITASERCKLVAYKDGAGIWTIGWGHTGPEVCEGMTVTQAQADALLQGDLRTAESAVTAYTHVTLSDNQYSALVSLVYNIGSGNYYKSGLRAAINAGGEIDSHWLAWDKDHNGVVEPGLVKRRKAELALYHA